MILTSSCFQVIDLEVNVSSEHFLKSIRKRNPDVIIMSCPMIILMEEMKSNIQEIRDHFSKRIVKIIVDGRPINKEFV